MAHVESPNHPQADQKKLAKLIHGIRIAMLTTVDAAGILHARPMATQELDAHGELWFFTSAPSTKVNQVERNHRVNLSYSDEKDNRYVSVAGRAELVRDRAKIQELWSPLLKAWFPKGKDDPSLALLRIHVEEAQYWDAPSSTLVKLVGFAKAAITGRRYEPGNSGTLHLS